MILFVFEGEKREPALYETIKRLYFPGKDDNIICSFGNNIYELYKEMRSLGDSADIVDVMKKRMASRRDNSLAGTKSADFSESQKQSDCKSD